MVKKLITPPITANKVEKKIANNGWNKNPAVINIPSDAGIKQASNKTCIINNAKKECNGCESTNSSTNKRFSWRNFNVK